MDDSTVAEGVARIEYDEDCLNHAIAGVETPGVKSFKAALADALTKQSYED